jgi:hypothetical protein
VPLVRTHDRRLTATRPSSQGGSHLVSKEALLSDDAGIYFTTPHFDGYAMVLVRLDLIEAVELEELIVEAWLDRAPRRLADAWSP